MTNLSDKLSLSIRLHKYKYLVLNKEEPNERLYSYSTNFTCTSSIIQTWRITNSYVNTFIY